MQLVLRRRKKKEGLSRSEKNRNNKIYRPKSGKEYI
jgi:hypothetical protein